MTRKMIFPLLFGLIGAGILVGLGTWQMQRLAWKNDILSQIDARINADPVAIPVVLDREADKYLPVQETGQIGTEEIHILASRKQVGAGYRIIAPFKIGDRTVLLDRGFIPTTEKDAARGGMSLTVTGNLHWPEETDGYTPAADIAKNIWFSRDVDVMAAALGTEPVLIVARSDTGQGVDPFPVDSAGIPNDHLQYAITWFSLAIVWLGMTAFLLWRIKPRTD